ncbi:MAG TPA: flavin reductase family protein [Firmicutes bacterium]|nr:flavin reductase family protein [Bacillota bacterium]
MQVQERYTQAITRKYPEQVVIAVAKDPQGKYNPITLGWTMITSHQPPMMAIAVGHNRYSKEAIETSGEFVIAFPSSSMAEAALFYGTKSGRDTDKFKEYPIAAEPAVEVDSLLLTDAVANFECKLEAKLVTGDHMLYVGRIVASHVNADPSVKRLYTLGPGYKMGAVRPE